MVEGKLEFETFEQNFNKMKLAYKRQAREPGIFLKNKEFFKAKMLSDCGKKTRKFANKFIENLFCNETIDESEFMSLVFVLEVWRNRNQPLLQSVVSSFHPDFLIINKEIRQLFCFYNFEKKKLKVRKYVKLKLRHTSIGNY